VLLLHRAYPINAFEEDIEMDIPDPEAGISMYSKFLLTISMTLVDEDNACSAKAIFFFLGQR
jgi:hypothetical protein